MTQFTPAQAPGKDEGWVGPVPRGWDKRQRTGLVLSGGGLKFAVHAGLYSRMEELPFFSNEKALPSSVINSDPANFDVLSEAFDCVVGTSAGSLLAAAWACGLCAEDAARVSLLFSRPDFQSMILDPNWLGAGSFLLKGDPGYFKGLYRGEAVQRTLEVIFSHNFLRKLGKLYQSYSGKRKQAKIDEAKFDDALSKIIRELRNMPREKLPDMSEVMTNTREVVKSKDQDKTLVPVTFQDINPGVRVPFERYRYSGDPAWEQAARDEAESIYRANQAHASAYRTALAEYYRGRAAAGRYVPKDPDAVRPMLLLIGTDLITGQKTIFSSYHLFEKELVYAKNSRGADPTGIEYCYINPKGNLSSLPNEITEELRPPNYLYKDLSAGLPVAWAIRSSLSIPGVFAPATIHYKDDYGVERTDFFIDGGITDNYALQVAADPNIGRCGRILGGNIGSMGPRIHTYDARNVVDILIKTLYTMGDGNVDSNAENRLVERAKVTTIDEITKNNVTSIAELEKIPALLEEGKLLADQFFGSFRDKETGLLALDSIFGPNPGSYIVFLPRIETYGQPLGLPAPPAPLTASGDEVATGASEIDRIALLANLLPEVRDEVKKARSIDLGKSEAALIPPPVVGPGGLLFGPVGLVLRLPGQILQPLAATDLVNQVRRAVLLILLTFVSLLAIGLWRGAVFVAELTGWRPVAGSIFDGWNYWFALGAVLIGALLGYLIFFRALIYDFWVARKAKFLRRTLEVPVSLVFAVAPVVILELVKGLDSLLRNALGLVLIPFSALALVFFVYALISFVRTLLGRRQEN
jgi:predicted acylesterase/phospholipase RssA